MDHLERRGALLPGLGVIGRVAVALSSPGYAYGAEQVDATQMYPQAVIAARRFL